MPVIRVEVSFSWGDMLSVNFNYVLQPCHTNIIEFSKFKFLQYLKKPKFRAFWVELIWVLLVLRIVKLMSVMATVKVSSQTYACDPHLCDRHRVEISSQYRACNSHVCDGRSKGWFSNSCMWFLSICFVLLYQDKDQVILDWNCKQNL